MKVSVISAVKDGKLIQNIAALQKAAACFEGNEVVVTIERKKRKRTNPQNSYLHGAVLPIIRNRLLELGIEEANSKEWVFDFVKANCLITEVVNTETGEILKSIGSSSSLATYEFNEFIERIKQYCSEKLSIYIPDPSEPLKIDFGL